jgi:hypothetical protein
MLLGREITFPEANNVDSNKIAKVVQQLLNGKDPPAEQYSEAAKQVLDFARALETIGGGIVGSFDRVSVITRLNVRNGHTVGAVVKCTVSLPDNLKFEDEKVIAALASCVAEEAGYGQVTTIIHGNEITHLTAEFSFSFK